MGGINSSKGISMKKINQKIVFKLLKSKLLRLKMKDYFKNYIFEEQCKKITSKFVLIFDKWKREVRSDYEKFKEVSRKIENDSKFKLPWTVAEVMSAIDIFVRIFEIQ